MIQRARQRVKLGATWANTPSTAAKDADIVLTMVFGPKQIEKVVHGENGLFSAMAHEQIWVDMTTNQPSLAKKLASAIAATGAQAIDAPVTGAIDDVRIGNMSKFAGGDEEAVERIRPVMEMMEPLY
jgi:3-hydroxyisobutyrate dehydrogenase